MALFLTVPDVIWLNRRITGVQGLYHYARLEEAVFLQYAQGDAKGGIERAAQVAAGFGRLRPFTRANRATGIGTALSLLLANGIEPAVASGNLQELATFENDPKSAASWLRGHSRPSKEAHGMPVAEALDSVMKRFGQDLAALDREEGDTPEVMVSAPRLSGEFVGL